MKRTVIITLVLAALTVGLLAQNPVSVAQVGATAVDSNSGVKSAGTLRVVIATDQPALTNKLLVTPDSVALPANQSVNISQMNGVTTTMGNGASGTGVQRVTIASDSTGIIALTTGAAQIGHLEANQSSNVAQINGVTPLMGNGATGTGALRVSIASDSTGIVALTTGAAQIGHLEANQSSNVAQINGVTPLMGNGVTGTGAMRVSIASDSTGVVQPGNTANTTAWLVQGVPGTANGLTPYTLEPVASDNHANIKNGAGVVYHIVAFNNSATINYGRLYNAASGFNGCNSATNLLWEFHIPANTSDAGFVEDIAMGVTFSTGISICVTGAYGQTSTTNATASAISLNIGYK